MTIKPNWVQLRSITLQHWQIGIVFTFIASIYVVWTWTDQIGSLSSDGPAYLVMAQHYAGEPALPGQLNRFPPLYPMALAGLQAARDLHRIHLVTTSFFLLAMLALSGWLCCSGLPTSVAALLVLLFAALPGSWLLALSPQSEFLYLLCSCLALLFLSMYERLGKKEALYAAALAIAAAALTRTIGVALVVPLMVAAFLQAPRRTGWVAVVLALSPLLLWHLLHRSTAGYLDSLNQYYSSGTGPAFLDQIKAEFLALREGLESNLAQNYTGREVVGLLGVLIGAATLYRAIQLRPDSVYLVGYMTVVFFWPFRDEAQRFLWPVLPLLVAQPILLLMKIRWVADPKSQVQMPMVILAATLLFLALPEISIAAERFRSADDSGIRGARGMRSWYQANPERAARRSAGEALAIDMLRRIATEVPPNDCVISIRPDLVNYFARRSAAWPPLDSVPDPAFSRQLHGARCHFLFMTTASYDGYPAPLHPLQRLTEKIKVIDYDEIPILAPDDGRIICMLAEFL